MKALIFQPLVFLTAFPIYAQDWDAIGEAFVAEVSQCWNVGSLSPAARKATVVVRFQMDRYGHPDPVTIRMVGSSGGSERSASEAFEVARRAILRCGTDGYDLPLAHYENWQEVEMTFNANGQGPALS
ncbi:MAG: hypothetical protein AAF376_14720 [Pseudomonadota bacterium]